MSIALSTLLYSAFRIAGVTDRPGRTPSTEQYADAIPTLNRMLSSWNIDRLMIYTQTINAYPLVAGQKIFTLGGAAVTGTNLSTTRPTRIEQANIIVNTTSPVVRFPVQLLTVDQWAAVQVQDIPGTIPWSLYVDGGNPITNLYLYGQALATYQLELYTWQSLPSFNAVTDSVILPDGYEHAIAFNLAVLLAASFPTQAHMSADAPRIAREALSKIESYNAPRPIMRCDSAVLGVGRRRRGADYYAYRGNTW